ncbi:hypothetical protein ACFLZO_00495 [Patescibacteria group bacterium]
MQMMQGEQETLVRANNLTVLRREIRLPSPNKMKNAHERWLWRAVYASSFLFTIFTFLNTYLAIRNA